MGAAVCLREDYDAAQMRGLAKGSSDAAQTRRLLALAMIYDGGSRTEAAKIGGVGSESGRCRGLGAGFQCRGAARPGQWQGAVQRVATHPSTPASVAADRRERPDPGGSRRG